MVAKIKYSEIKSEPYTSNFNEMVIWIASTVYEMKYARKKWLSNLSKFKGSTFDRALEYLITNDIVKEKITKKEPDKNINSLPVKDIFICWNRFESPDIVSEISSLEYYQKIDLSDYPIRGIDKLTPNKKVLLRKFIFRIENTKTKYNKYKIDKLFDTLNIRDGCNIFYLTKLLNIKYNEVFSIIRNLIRYNKVEIGICNNNVAVWKHPDCSKSGKYWKCENCNAKNSKKNDFCGKCGGSKKID